MTADSARSTHAEAAGPVTILYGSETGNAQSVAAALAQTVTQSGIPAQMLELDEVTADSLAQMTRVAVVCSTYGDGELPYNAGRFGHLIEGAAAPRLEAMSFAVCALGDSSYDDFCNAGRLIDHRLEILGARRLIERVDCDVAWEQRASEWRIAVAAAFAPPAPPPQPVPECTTSISDPASEGRSWNRTNPYPATIVTSLRLTGTASDKEVRHYELDLADSGLDYRAGDGLAVMPSNDPELVTALLDHLGFEGDVVVGDRSLRDELTVVREIVTPSRELLAVLAERSPDDEVRTALGERTSREALLRDRDLLGLVTMSGLAFGVEEFAALLRPLQPRTYSISSSPLVSPTRIDLLVASVRYRCGGRSTGGVCSTYLADRRRAGQTVDVFLQPNEMFRLPPDDADLIMVGPGTGVAPFRGFLQEREARGATGRNWLLCGDRRRRDDFHYEAELTDWVASGHLTHLDLAFSRDQAQKVYVQHRMRESGARLTDWLAGGAYFFVCGDALHMARDVDSALHEILAEHSGGDTGAAETMVAQLKSDKRYRRDVY